MAFSDSSQRGHENIIEGKIIGLNVTPKYCCPLCNADMPTLTEDPMITCNNCRNIFLTLMVKSK